MLFDTSAYLNERAAYNSIDLSEYFTYPKDILRQILYALESGCSKRQVNKVIQESGKNEFPMALQAIIGKPDVDFFVDELYCGKEYQTKDLREELLALSMLLPPDGYGHSWRSASSGFSKDVLESYVQDSEPEISLMIIYLLAADLWMQENCSGKDFMRWR